MGSLVWVPVLVLMVAALFVVAGVNVARSGGRGLARREGRDGWERVDARIVGWEGRWVGSSLSRERYRFPVVEHELPDGSTARFLNPTGRSAVPWRLRHGGPVTVVRDPRDPTRAEIETTQRDRATRDTAHVVMGTIFAVAGLLIAALTVAVWVWVA